MCAVFERKGRVFRPGRPVFGIGPGGVLTHPWAGFAREEILEWWQRKGGVLIDLPAERFAERSEVTGKLIWGEIESGLVLRGLLDTQGGKPSIKVVTRGATAEEQTHYQHPRMPVLQCPLFPPLELPIEPEEGLLF